MTSPHTLTIQGIDSIGDHDTDSAYVRDWWMPLLGPTSSALLQILVEVDGQTVLFSDVAFRLGVASRATNRSHNPTLRALSRLETFRVISWDRDRGLVKFRRRMKSIDTATTDKWPVGVRLLHSTALAQAGQ